MASSPITQVDEPRQSLSLADQLAGTPNTTIPPSASTNSIDPGPKPARPPKAAKRPSTASRRHEDHSEGTTLIDTPNGTQSEMKNEPESMGVPVATVDVQPGQPPVAPVVEAKKEENSGAAAPTAAPSGAAPARSPTVGSSSTPAPPKTASPTSPAPSTASPSTSTAPPPVSTSTPAAAKLAKSPSSAPKKKKKGGLASLFACFPCVSNAGHDDSPPNSGGLQKRPSTAARILEKEREKEKSATTSASSSPSAGGEKEAVNSEKQPLAPVDLSAALTPPPQEPLAAASPDTPAGPPPPTSGPTQSGIPLPLDETEGVTSGAVVPPGQQAASQIAAQEAAAAGLPAPHAPTKTKRKRSGKHPAPSGTEGIITSVPEPGAPRGGLIMSSSSDSSSDSEDEDATDEDEEEEDEEQALISRGGVGIPIGEDGLPHPLLPELSEDLKGRKCLVLDLDETLVHSSFKMVHQADYVVPVEIENQFHNVYVIKRPGVDGFLKAMGEIYEVVVFTASLSKYADPVLDQLDVHRVVKHRLFRESCYNNKGNYVKDLSQLGRPMEESIIIDNSPASYVFHPNNAVPISSWFNDPHDTELTDLVPFLTDLAGVDDVRAVLDANLYQHLMPQPEQPAEGAPGATQREAMLGNA